MSRARILPLIPIVGLLAAPAVFGDSVSITSLSPSAVAAGGAQFNLTVTISLTNLPGNPCNDVKVSLDGTALKPVSPPPFDPTFFFDLPNATSFLVVTVPANLLLLPHPGVISVSADFCGTGGPTNKGAQSTLTVYGAPTLTGLAPPSIAPGSSGFTLDVSGTGIQPAATVYWDSGSGTPTALSSSPSVGGVSGIVPQALVATAGVALITVKNPGFGTASNGLSFFIGAAPLINPGGLSPSSAVPGGADIQLTIAGSSFQPTSAVQWTPLGGASTPLQTSFVSASQLTAVIPASLTNQAVVATIQVVNPGGLKSNSVAFAVAPLPVPTIAPNGLNPALAITGSSAQPITVTGTNFASGATLEWAGTASQSISTSFVSATQLNAVIPGTLLATAVVASVSVKNPSGAVSNSATFTVGSPPAISATGGLTPASVNAGSSGFQLSVQGANFVSGAVVRWDDGSGASATNPKDLTTQFVSATQLSASVPSNLVAVPLTAAITVRNPNGTISNAALFNVGTPTTINSAGLTPASAIAGGSSFSLSVTGTNFTPGATVQWDGGAGIQSLSTGLIDSTHLTAIVPATFIAAPGAALISVKSPNGTQTPSVAFIIQAPAPVISATGGLTPATTPTGTGTLQITVNGANYQNGAVVQWNPGAGNQALLTGFASPNQLTAVLPSSLLTTAVTAIVTVKNPDGSTSNPVLFTVGNAPAITPGGLNPTATTVGGPTFTLTVNGQNFQQSSQVRWNAGTGPVNIGTGFVSSTQLTAVVPSTLITSVGFAVITVLNGDGVASNAEVFQIGPVITLTPSITTLDKSLVTAGTGSFTITASGTNFFNGSVVQWNTGGSAQNLPTGVNTTNGQGVVTQLTALVPASLVTAPGVALITVLNPSGAVSNAKPFIIQAAGAASLPTITDPGGIRPTGATAGGPAFTLAVSGTNFVNASVVVWNTGGTVQTLNTGYVLSAAGTVVALTAVVPASLIANVGVALITVSNPGGAVSNAVEFDIIAAGGASLPSITTPGGLTPAGATAGDAAFSLTVKGTSFVNSSVVLWNTGGTVQTLNTGYVLSGGAVVALTAVVPAALIANVGVALITVSNPGGAISNAVEFDITAGVPVITQLVTSGNTDPVAGSGSFQLRVQGRSFVSGSVVRWDNGAGPQSLTTGFLAGALELTALVPAALIANPGTAFITVANPGGTVSNTLPLTIGLPANTVPPFIKTVTPPSKDAGGPAFQLTLTGSGFVTGATVTWNAGANSQTLTTGLDAGTLIALVPAALLTAPGPVFISVTNPGGAVSNTVVFNINPLTGSAPSINSSNGLNPASAIVGSPGFQLQVLGNSFQNGSIVQWNSGSGPQALQTGFVSVSQLNALVPTALLTTPGTAFVTVLNPGGTASNAVSFAIGGAAATITTLNPSSAPTGTSGLQVAIAGANFSSGATVSWGGTTLPASIVSPTQMSVVVPGNLLAAPGQTVVTVQNSSGTSNAVTFTVNPPTLTGLNPTSVVAGSAAFTLTVTGTNFVGGSSVIWSGTNLSTTVVSSTQVTAQVSAGLIAAAGTANVIVASPGGATTSALSFTVTAPSAPILTSVLPASAVAGGQSFQLAVTGTGFLPGAQVLWNGSALFSTVQSPTQITALVDSTQILLPQAATVVVQNTGSPLSAGLKFAVNGPGIATINPAVVSAGAPGFTLAVTGTNFLAGSVVVWNGISLPTAFSSATALSAPVSASLVASSGTVSVTVQNPGGSASAAVTFLIGPFTLAVTTATLPDAVIGSLYSQILAATGGSPPYTWSVSGGALPAGLALDASGTLSGTATVPNTVSVGFTVTDSVGRTAAKTLTLRSALPIAITSVSPLPTILTGANPYTYSLQGSGGTQPYTWTAAGSLPPGFALGSASGQITGIPGTPGNYQFTVTLTDSRQQAISAVFGWTILPQPQSFAITGLTNPAQPAQQPGIAIGLANPYPVDITGTMSLTFVPAVGVDDPNVQFSTGGRQVQYTIRAGDTTASVFQQPPATGQTAAPPPQTSLSLLTGTTAGAITLSARASAASSDITPSPAPVLTAQVPKVAPVITRMTLSAATGGVSISVSGYSTTREVSQGTLQFAAAQGSNLNNSTITVPLSSLFSTWYQNSASLAFGTQFTVAIPVSVQGSAGVITGVTVTLTNSAGTSAPASATLQ